MTNKTWTWETVDFFQFADGAVRLVFCRWVMPPNRDRQCVAVRELDTHGPRMPMVAS